MPELTAEPEARSASVPRLASRREGRQQKANRPYEAVVAFSIVLASMAPVLLVALGLAGVQVAGDRDGVLLTSSAQSGARPSSS